MDRRAVRGHAASEHGGDERDGGAAAAVSSGKLLKARRAPRPTTTTTTGADVQNQSWLRDSTKNSPEASLFGRLARHEGLITVPSQLPSPGCTP